MLVHQRFVPGLAIASYIIGDEATGEAAVVDPTRDVEDFVRFAEENDLRIRHIFETHVHADFVSGARELKARLEGEPVIHASGDGGQEWTADYADHVAKNGDEVALGLIRLKALHTPGHTPEHVCWEVYDDARSKDTPWLMFSGDFLFVGDVGRPDLLGEEARKTLAHQLYESLFKLLPAIPDITEILPAHGAGSLCGKAMSSRRSSTVGFERLFNPSLVEKPEPQWVEDLLRDMPPAPPYFRRMKRVNKEGPPVLGPGLPGLLRRTAKELDARRQNGVQVLDVRSKEAFSAAHIPGAINIPFGPTLPTWAGWVLSYEKPILLVVEPPEQLRLVITSLIRVGFDNLQGYLDGAMEAWETAGYPVGKVSTISARDLHQRLDHKPNGVTVLDVRTDGEWKGGHIAGALHIHGGMLPERLSEVPRERPVAVVCRSGSRSSIASSILQRAGFTEVINVVGGMSAWKSAGLPTATD
jgi:hydroxyacylglutathione hydrolase